VNLAEALERCTKPTVCNDLRRGGHCGLNKTASLKGKTYVVGQNPRPITEIGPDECPRTARRKPDG
jgi:hypothetical protein